MARQPSQSQWHQSAGKWTYSLGVRGVRVQLFQKRSGEVFYRTLWLDGRRINRRSLETVDRARAERLASELLRALLRGDELAAGAVLTLRELWERFNRECVAFLDNTPRSIADARGRAEVLLAFFGEDCDVSELGQQDMLAFTKKRLAGGIRCAPDRVTGAVRMRSVECDLALLVSMLLWATTYRLPRGQRLLARNPLAGIKRAREQDPRRPVATWERYQATRAALQQLAGSAPTNSRRRRWTLVELALVLAEATGRRLSSILHLRWEDVDLSRRSIRWRAVHDKMRREWIIPIPEQLAGELQSFRVSLGAIAGLIFASPKNPEQPLDRSVFVHALPHAERVAGLEKLDGSCWHAYRRKWATERKHLPVKDVAAAGGWKDTQTLLTCYQQADEHTLLEVMSCPKKLTERAREA